MLKRLLNRLHIIMTEILMVLITLILAFSFWNTYQSSQTADITYIQRMTSLMLPASEATVAVPLPSVMLSVMFASAMSA